MKFIFLPLFLIVLFSCADNQKISSLEKLSAESKVSVRKDHFSSTQNPTIQKWIAFHQKVNPKFKAENFLLESQNEFGENSDELIAVFDQDFEKIYEPFLIYSPNREKYIDFDSSTWFADENNEVGFDVHQDVYLINIPAKTTSKITFLGSGGLVEDAYWVNDTVFVLLQNNFGEFPQIEEYNLRTNTCKTFIFKGKITPDSAYSMERIETKLKRKLN